VATLAGDELVAWLRSPVPAPLGEDPLVVVGEPPTVGRDELPALVERLSTLPKVVVALADAATDHAATEPGHALADVVVDATSLDALRAAVAPASRAAIALALLLRGGGRRTIGDGLVAESAVYSTLQGGPEFAAWLASRAGRSRRPSDDGPAVVVTREGDVLAVELNRPAVHNAFSARMREELLDALAVARAEPALAVVLRGSGPSFCSGGDLDEFGTFADPVSAHLLRLDRSVGAVLASMADRVTVELHGACVGAGIELPAFASTVRARPDARIKLPEVGLGLVPGAGGTVSLPRRIGRHRTAWLALSQEWLDVPTAARWGLVDEVSPAVV
jgi:hypothetical protein